MLKDAEVTPANEPVDSMAPDSSTKEGRGALPDWKALGYITPKYSRAVTRAVEYSCNDFGLYQVASGLGKSDDAEKYLNRSRNWRNHFNSGQTSLGFKGFVVPRNSSGFIETDPLNDSGYWSDPYYEASSWAYTWAAVHDMKHMIELMGGRQTVLNRLDTMFTPGADGSDSGMIFDPTNEPYVPSPDATPSTWLSLIKKNVQHPLPLSLHLPPRPLNTPLPPHRQRTLLNWQIRPSRKLRRRRHAILAALEHDWSVPDNRTDDFPDPRAVVRVSCC